VALVNVLTLKLIDRLRAEIGDLTILTAIFQQTIKNIHPDVLFFLPFFSIFKMKFLFYWTMY